MAQQDTDMRVQHRADASRYELYVGDDLAGIADYRERDDGSLVFPHTEIDPARRGQGLGAVLVQGALDDVRSNGGTVVPQCWYVAQFIRQHPEYRDLAAG
jgi:uncharacterized protein